jgi:pSer/pThr/pTyr-binding forkhead associated (FHA) protein
LDEADSEALPAKQDRAIQPGFVQTQTRAGDSVSESVSPVLPPTLKVPSGPILLVSLNGRTSSYPITKPETLLGRSESNDIPLAEQTVTGKHAVIRLENKTLTIEDLGSTNGTFVNGERIRSQVIKHGDRIKLGQVELTLKE